MASTAGLFLGYQAGLLEDAQMLHNRREGHAVRPGKFGDGGLAEHEGGEDGAARGIGECAEGGIE